MNMPTYSLAHLLGIPKPEKPEPSKQAVVKPKPASAKTAPARTRSAKAKPVAVKVATKPKNAISFSPLQAAADAGEADYLTTESGNRLTTATGAAILTAAAKARTP